MPDVLELVPNNIETGESGTAFTKDSSCGRGTDQHRGTGGAGQPPLIKTTVATFKLPWRLAFLRDGRFPLAPLLDRHNIYLTYVEPGEYSSSGFEYNGRMFSSLSSLVNEVAGGGWNGLGTAVSERA